MQNYKKFLVILFLILIPFSYLLLMPVTVTVQKDGKIDIYSSGFTKIYIFNLDTSKFTEDSFFFHRTIDFNDFEMIHYRNSFLRFFDGDSLVQEQTNNKSASVFISKKILSYNNEFIGTNAKWILDESQNFIKYFQKNLEKPKKLFILYVNVDRSFHINPGVLFINSRKDIAHEISHYYFGNLIDYDDNDTWFETISEVNSMLYLKKYMPEYYFNEIDLKTLNFYNKEYGKDVIDFLRLFSFNDKKIFEFERSLLKSHKYLNNKKFFELAKKFDK